jgi:hypothetical protein
MAKKKSAQAAPAPAAAAQPPQAHSPSADGGGWEQVPKANTKKAVKPAESAPAAAVPVAKKGKDKAAASSSGEKIPKQAAAPAPAPVEEKKAPAPAPVQEHKAAAAAPAPAPAPVHEDAPKPKAKLKSAGAVGDKKPSESKSNAAPAPAAAAAAPVADAHPAKGKGDKKKGDKKGHEAPAPAAAAVSPSKKKPAEDEEDWETIPVKPKPQKKKPTKSKKDNKDKPAAAPESNGDAKDAGKKKKAGKEAELSLKVEEKEEKKPAKNNKGPSLKSDLTKYVPAGSEWGNIQEIDFNKAVEFAPVKGAVDHRAPAPARAVQKPKASGVAAGPAPARNVLYKPPAMFGAQIVNGWGAPRVAAPRLQEILQEAAQDAKEQESFGAQLPVGSGRRTSQSRQSFTDDDDLFRSDITLSAFIPSEAPSGDANSNDVYEHLVRKN